MPRGKPIVVVILLFFIYPNAVFSKTKTTIDDIYPLYLRTGERGTLLISGHHLEKIDSCELKAVHGSGTVDYTGCAVDRVENSGQIQVSVDLGQVNEAGEFLLSLSSKTGDKTYVVKVVTPIQVVLKDNPAGAGVTNTSASTTSKGSGPYADCININPSKIPGLGPQNSAAVDCASSLLTNKEVTDNFGGHVNSIYYAIQVRVANRNSNYDFLLRDILLTLPDGRVVSGRVRRFAQGVAVKGKSEDTRARWYNWLQATSSLYGSLSVFSFASTDFKNVGNIFQGPFLAGFNQVFPDYTVDNVNRFNNAVFDDQKPSIVPKDSIGQPPLYVVALLPKVKGSEAYIKRFGEGISVALEGTFIKQISIVSLTPDSLKFGPEYSLQAFTHLSDNYDMDAIGKDSPGQAVQISNSSSSPTTINKISITAGGKDSDDFKIINNQGTCGNQNPTTHEWSPATKFTIPAQGSCVFYVKSTPQSAGPTSATVVLDGENIDGTKSVLLSGSGAGLLIDTYDASSPKKKFGCSMLSGNCVIDLGLVGNSVDIPLFYFVQTDGAAQPLTATLLSQDGISLKTSDCKPVAPTATTANPSCKITLSDLDKNQVGLSTLSLSLGDVKTNIKLKYQITKTTTTLSLPSLTVGSPADITVSVVDSSGKAVDKGNIMLLVNDKEAAGQAPVSLGADGTVKIPFTPAMADPKLHITAKYLGEAKYHGSDDQKDTSIAKAQPSITTEFGNPSSANPVSVTVTLAKPCAGGGTLSYQLDGGGSKNTQLLNNTSNLNLGPLSAGQHKLKLGYSGDAACAQGDFADRTFAVAQ